MGTQTFYAADDCPIELKVMRGLLGFHIQEPTNEDLKTLKRIEITSNKPWIPKEHIDDDEAMDFYSHKLSVQHSTTNYGIDNIIPAKDLYFYDPSDVNVTPLGEPIEIPCFPSPEFTSHAQAMSTWHHTVHNKADPSKIQPYLAFRPLEVVRRTLENTTQLAKMIVRFPLRRHIKS